MFPQAAARQTQSVAILERWKPSKAQWELTSNGFDKLLSLFAKDREQAGAMYETMRRKLLKFFERRHCRFPDACADETIDRVIRKLDRGENIYDVVGYFYGVARIVFLETIKMLKREQDAVDASAILSQAATGKEEMELKLEHLECAMQELSASDRDLIVAYYQSSGGEKIERRKALAAQHHISPNTLRIRTHRIRAKLGKHCARLSSIEP